MRVRDTSSLQTPFITPPFDGNRQLVNQEPRAEQADQPSGPKKKLGKKYQEPSIARPGIRSPPKRKGFFYKARRLFTPRLKQTEVDLAAPDQRKKARALLIEPSHSWSPPNNQRRHLPIRGVSDPVYIYSSTYFNPEPAENKQAPSGTNIERDHIASSVSPPLHRFKEFDSRRATKQGIDTPVEDCIYSPLNFPVSTRARASSGFSDFSGVFFTPAQVDETESSRYAGVDQEADHYRSFYTPERKYSRSQQVGLQPRDKFLNRRRPSVRENRKHLSIGSRPLSTVSKSKDEQLASQSDSPAVSSGNQSYSSWKQRNIETTWSHHNIESSFGDLFDGDPEEERYYPGNSSAQRVLWEDFANGDLVELKQSRSQASSIYSSDLSDTCSLLERKGNLCDTPDYPEVRPLNIQKSRDKLQAIPISVSSLRTRDRHQANKRPAGIRDSGSTANTQTHLANHLDQESSTVNDSQLPFNEEPNRGGVSCFPHKTEAVTPRSVFVNPVSDAEFLSETRSKNLEEACLVASRPDLNEPSESAKYSSFYSNISLNPVRQRIQELTAATNSSSHRERDSFKSSKPISITTDKRFSQLLSKWEQSQSPAAHNQQGPTPDRSLRHNISPKKNKKVTFEVKTSKNRQQKLEEQSLVSFPVSCCWIRFADLCPRAELVVISWKHKLNTL